MPYFSTKVLIGSTALLGLAGATVFTNKTDAHIEAYGTAGSRRLDHGLGWYSEVGLCHQNGVEPPHWAPEGHSYGETVGHYHSLTECKSMCDVADCAGFAVKLSSGKCTLWYTEINEATGNTAFECWRKSTTPPPPFVDNINAHILAYGTEFQQVTTGQCCSPAAASGTPLHCAMNECRRFEGGDMYQLATEFAGEEYPMKDGSMVDLTAYSFRMSTVTSEPPGTSLDTTNNYVVFNNGIGTSDCSTSQPCLCECAFTTFSPTSSPTASGAKVLPCADMPSALATDSFGGNATAAPIDVGVTMYDPVTKDVSIRPWINWDSDYLFNNLEGGGPFLAFGAPAADTWTAENLPHVSGWVDILPFQTYPYTSAVGSGTIDYKNSVCRIDMDANGEFPLTIMPGVADCFVTTTDTVLQTDGTFKTNYDFYVATTICYTNQPKDVCENVQTFGPGTTTGGAGTWQTEAYQYPDQFHVSMKVVTTDPGDASTDLSQCRRTWQLVTMKIHLGGQLEILASSTVDVQMAVEQSDGSIAMPDAQVLDWQVYKDYGSVTIQPANYIVTKEVSVDNTVAYAALATTAGDGQDLFTFGNYYKVVFDLEDTTKYADKTISYWLEYFYDTVAITYAWQRLDEITGTWVDMTDRYTLESTAIATDATTQVTFANTVNTITTPIVYDAAKALAEHPNSVTNFEIVGKFAIKSQLFVEDSIRLQVDLLWSKAGRRRMLSQQLVVPISEAAPKPFESRMLLEDPPTNPWTGTLQNDNFANNGNVDVISSALLKQISETLTDVAKDIKETQEDTEESSVVFYAVVGLLGLGGVFLLAHVVRRRTGGGGSFWSSEASIVRSNGMA